jgi:putative glycosyltransferase (TIGR04348 family)
MVVLAKIGIATPAQAAANNGNWHTAARWAAHLAAVADVSVFEHWEGQPLDLLVALHARKSAASIEAFRRARPGGRIVLVMTGTDLYRDLPAADPAALRSLDLADDIVVLQDLALRALPPAAARRARVIVQSCGDRIGAQRATDDDGPTRFIAIGHLRDVKDPLTLARAARRLRDEDIDVEHVGAFLDPGLADELRRITQDCPRYRLPGGLPHEQALARLARADALVHPSKMEGGANVVIEAVCAGIPVLASAVDGNMGLLGPAYEGYFPAGDDERLAALMRRFASDRALRARLRGQLDALRERFTPEREAAAVRALVEDAVRR